MSPVELGGTVQSDSCVERACDDGEDSDHDGAVDCADSDCAEEPACLCPVSDELSGAFGTWRATGALEDVLDPTTCSSSSSGNEARIGWIAPYQGCFQLSTDSTDYDTVAYVLAGDDCDGEEIACDDDSGQDRASKVTWWGQSGTDYVLVADAYSPDHSGALVFTIAGVLGGAQGDVSLGRAFGDGVASGSTAGAGADTAYGSCVDRGGSSDVVVEWLAASTGTWQVDTEGSSFDTAISVLVNCTEVECDDDSGEGTASKAVMSVTEGDLVQIVITGFQGATGDYVLNITSGG